MRMRRWWLALVMPVIAAACSEPIAEPSTAAASTGLRFLGGDGAGGFARARVARDFVFPADHGSHPEFRTEWWYFTGNLATASGRHFGFELTFFRYALAGSSPNAERANASAWRTEQIWMAHFAVTDTANGRFIARERLTREALGLAGAQADPLRVWVKDWSATGEATDEELLLRLEASDDDVALGLRLASTMPSVAQGDRGLDAKGAGEGNASYYYSVPRLAADGDITVGGETLAVTGLAWLDREWSTSSLEPGTVGWEWFALHLSDGGSLMFYRLRTANGAASPFSGGSLVSPDGARTRLGADEVEVVPVGYWTSETGVRYPVSWRLTAPKAGIALEIEPYLANQELDLSVRYWEGAVRAVGTGPEGALSAQGYLELAGY
jgi:predicted secreted hydrolase